MENKQEIKFYSVAEVSEILGISRSKAYEWVISPYCPFSVLRIGRRLIRHKSWASIFTLLVLTNMVYFVLMLFQKKQKRM